jgi:hydrogenase 3 maturation protease
MTDLKTLFRQTLQGAERVAVLGVGSSLRGDDAAGMLAAEQVLSLGKAQQDQGRLAVFLGETAPENLTGPIKSFRPTLLIVIDAADMGKTPGRVQVIDPTRVADAGSCSTHSLPLNVLTAYLRDELACRVVIVAIQPGSCGFGQSPCPAVVSAARRVAGHILRELPRET